jgi:flagellar motor switch protein FliM
MPKVLTQEEIDSLFTAAQKAPKAKVPEKKTFAAYDLRQSRKIDSDHVQILTTLHENLARRLGNSLAAYLRVGFEMNLVSIQQMSFREFMTRMPEMTYFTSLHILPIDARAIFQADLALVFPIVDVILGGTGADQIEPRDLTEIEEQIFETVVGLIVRDLQLTWAAVLQLDIHLEQRQPHAQVQSLMMPMEKILTLSFEIRLASVGGIISFAFPAVVANALMRKLSVQWSFAGPLPSRETRRQIRQRLLEARFETTLCLAPSGVTVRELIALEPGSLLVLPHRANEPVYLNVAEKPMFLAYPVRHARHRGARIDQRLSLAASQGRESK